MRLRSLLLTLAVGLPWSPPTGRAQACPSSQNIGCGPVQFFDWAYQQTHCMLGFASSADGIFDHVSGRFQAFVQIGTFDFNTGTVGIDARDVYTLLGPASATPIP